MVEPERPSLEIPAELSRRAYALIHDAAEWTPPVPRDAATVVLLCERNSGVEVFLQRRLTGMAFAAGMHVFPGGRVEVADIETPWVGDEEREPFPLPPNHDVTSFFRAICSAGARETWEEAGVVLAEDRDGPVARTPGDPDADFVAWLRAEGLHVNGAAFQPWTHWITPEVESRRFDTRMVVAAIPSGQHAADRGLESDQSFWVRPGEALDRMRAGEIAMLPPTIDALTQLADFDTVAAVMAAAARRKPRPWLPRPYADSGGGIAWRIVDAYTGEPVDLS